MNIDHQESLEAEVVRLREELAESRRHADGMARAPYGEFEAMREERDRLARRVAELEAALRDARSMLAKGQPGSAKAAIDHGLTLAGDGGGA